MAVSKEALVELGRDVNETLGERLKVQFAASTREVFNWLGVVGKTIPGEGTQAQYRMLGILAEHGYPGATRGAATQVKRYGKMVTIHPWQWKAVSDEAVEAWAREAGPTPRVNVSAKMRELEARVQDLQMRVEALEKSLAEALGTVGQ